MKRRTLAFILALTMIFSCGIVASAEETEVVMSAQTVTVDGEEVSVTAYNIGGYNYFRLRDMAVMLNGTDSQFDVGYDAEAQAIAITTYTGYTGSLEILETEDASETCVASAQTISVDGKALTLEAYNIGDFNYFKLRDLGNYLGFNVDFEDGSNTAVVESTEALSFDKASYTEINCKLNGKDIVVGMYEAVYAANPNRIEDQQIAVYISPYATKDSPIIFMVNNSGWMSNAYTSRNGPVNYGTVIDDRSGEEEVVGDYYSDSDNDPIGRALSEGYVIVSCGARSRGNGANADGEHLGHSPATMTDTKAAFRWLQLNKAALPAGDPDKIVVTGTSGGGALSVVLSATGDSPDYYESLYEIGAAGIEKNADGTYTSTLSDAVWATIAYCPITDLGNACAAYEWQWGEARAALMEEGVISYRGATAEEVNENSAALAALYVEYVNSLGIGLTSETLKDSIIELMEAEIADAIADSSVEAVQATIVEEGCETWVTVNDDGTFTYDYDAHLYWVGTQSAFKIAPAFSNVGTGYGEFMNEDNLFGGVMAAYSPFNEYSWNIDSTEGNGVGLDDTGLNWDQYMQTEAGQALAQQIKMTSPIEYLLDTEDGATTAPNWYVRYGMADRDSSFAVEALLYAAMTQDPAIVQNNFSFAWLQPHSGNYDVQEAYDWLGSQIDWDRAASKDERLSFEDAVATELTVLLDGEELGVTRYTDAYVSTPDRAWDQQLALYVPENATAESPIIFMVQNSGWQSNSFSGALNRVVDGREYASSSDTDAVGRALSEGYVIVSCGARSRNNGLTGSEYLGHSPGTMTDNKAVIRYLRYNADLLPAGDPDTIVVTGGSGGGALSVVLAASGDSEDYYEDLYMMGAAGIEFDSATGAYVSTISDAVWGTIAYCPITDLGNACAAYEWQWGEARAALMAEGHETYSGDNDYGIPAETMAEATAILTENFVEYIDSLGIGVNSENLEETIIALMKAEIEDTIAESSVKAIQATIAEEGCESWITVNDDGTFTYDYDAHVKAVAAGQQLKPASAFSNDGIADWTGMNEDNLFGTTADEYSPFNEYSWNNDAVENAVGLDDTGLTWDEYLATDAGQYLQLQMKMTSPIQYLLDAEGESASAGNWYVRYGMKDRDSSFAVEAVLLYSLYEDQTIEDINFEYAWLKGHGGNYDVQEAYNWLTDRLNAEKIENKDDYLSFDDAVETEIHAKLDGEDIVIKRYVDYYVAAPNRVADQQIALFVPDNATADSPIIFMVRNGGWQSNDFAGALETVTDYGTIIDDGEEEIVGDYYSDSDNDPVGKALAEGYVIAVCGARSRRDGATYGEHLGHSPATMVDTKAAFRYLRHNADLLPAGDPEKIVVTGTSGGGALSVVLSASGDSADYLPYLYEIGAAGVELNEDGTYTSTVSDAVWGTIAYCPITDLGNACAAYEWQWGEARTALLAEDFTNDAVDYSQYGKGTIDDETINEASAALIAMYEEYVDSLGIGVTSATLRDAIIELMEAEIADSIAESSVEAVRATIAEQGCESWVTVNDDGTFTYDYDAHVRYVAECQKLKVAPAFSNNTVYPGSGERNEDNLFGAINVYESPFNAYSWDNDAVADNGVGLDDTGLTWDEYMETEEGQYLQLQMKMTSPIQYLLDAENESTSAPNWYVRYGMKDRDSSFAVEAILLYSMYEDATIEDIDFEYAWLKGHSGNYDVQEAYAWLAEALAK